MEEVWKLCPIAPEYEVSNIGRVRHKKNKRIRKVQQDESGYYSIAIRDIPNHKTVRLKIHRMVATTFIPNPNNLPVINHKDGNKANNTVDNLEWVTQQDNLIHAVVQLGKNRKISDKQAKQIQQEYKPYTYKGKTGSVKWLAKKYNISQRQVYDILRGVTCYNTNRVTRCKLTEEDMDNIIARYTPHTIKDIMAEYGMSVHTFYKIILPHKGLTIKDLKKRIQKFDS